jgi:hypothetical protein
MEGMNLFKKGADGIPQLSPSQINLLLTCGAKWRGKYVDKMKDPGGVDSKIGNFMHEALELAVKSQMDGQDITANDVHRMAYEPAIMYFSDPEQVKELRNDDAQEALSRSDDVSKLSADLAAVAWNWFKQSGMQPIEVEKSVEMLTEFKGNKVKIGGRLDLLATDRNGDKVIIDWKSSGRAPSKNMTGGYVMDRQHVIQQLIYAKCLIGVGIDVKRVGTLKVTKTRTPAAYYAFVDVTPGMLAFCDGIIQSAIQMVYSDLLPPNPIGAGALCSSKYCFMWDICPGSSKHIEPSQQGE